MNPAKGPARKQSVTDSPLLDKVPAGSPLTRRTSAVRQPPVAPSSLHGRASIASRAEGQKLSSQTVDQLRASVLRLKTEYIEAGRPECIPEVRLLIAELLRRDEHDKIANQVIIDLIRVSSGRSTEFHEAAWELANTHWRWLHTGSPPADAIGRWATLLEAASNTKLWPQVLEAFAALLATHPLNDAELRELVTLESSRHTRARQLAAAAFLMLDKPDADREFLTRQAASAEMQSVSGLWGAFGQWQCSPETELPHPALKPGFDHLVWLLVESARQS